MRTLEWQTLLQTYAGYAAIAVAFYKIRGSVQSHSGAAFVTEAFATLIFFAAMYYLHYRVQERLITFDRHYEFYAAKRHEGIDVRDTGPLADELGHSYFWTFDTQTIISALCALGLIAWQGVDLSIHWIWLLVLLPILFLLFAISLYRFRRQLRMLMPNLIWYAAYGSNLSRKRFRCYIKGCAPEGSTRKNPGCVEKAMPLAAKSVSLNLELFFAGSFEGWGGTAAAFVRQGGASAAAFGRMYLITHGQFNDIVRQENDLAVRKGRGTRIVPSMEQLSRGAEFELEGTMPYPRLLVVGREKGHPIVTFTSSEKTTLPTNKPSETYVKVIASGLKETYSDWSINRITDYLSQAEGIRDRIPRDRLAEWIASS